MERSVKITAIICATIIVISISALVATIPLKQSAQTSVGYPGMKREFWLFDTEIPGFNETKMGMPNDVYSMSTITVFKGDKVVIHFFNIEGQGGDSHSFTIYDKPYNISVEVNPGENKTITFDANTTGIFTYYCTFHQPTMRGQLIVQTPPST